MDFQPFARYEPRAQLRQFPFAELGIMIKKEFGEDELQNGVAEKFQALIVEMVALCFVSRLGCVSASARSSELRNL
jgi:hypothetical protein